MKLVQINTTVGTGSTGRIADSIGRIAIDNQIESYIGYGREGKNLSKSKLIPIGNSFDMLYHGFETVVFDRHGLASRHATRNFIKRLVDINPDVIHLHNIHGYFLNYELLFQYLQKAQKPIVWTFHDSWPFTGHCTYFDNIGCERWKTSCHSCPKKRFYPSSYIFDRSKLNFFSKKALFTAIEKLTIITPSKWLADLVGQSFFRGRDIRVIHNGVDTNLFRIKSKNDNLLKKYQVENKRLLLGVASIWDKRKGLEDFIELSRLISKEFVIVLVGLSKKQIDMLPSNIIGITRTENIETLVDWYNAAEVFINPTWQDNFPTTNIEALACGTPVITYRTGGSPESLSKSCGTVVEKGDLAAIMLEIETLSSKGAARQQDCRNRAIDYFSDSDRFHDYIKLYKELIAA